MFEHFISICGEILHFGTLGAEYMEKRVYLAVFYYVDFPHFREIILISQWSMDANHLRISLVCIGIDSFESNFSWSYASEQTRDLMPSAGARAASRPLFKSAVMIFLKDMSIGYGTYWELYKLGTTSNKVNIKFYIISQCSKKSGLAT